MHDDGVLPLLLSLLLNMLLSAASVVAALVVAYPLTRGTVSDRGGLHVRRWFASTLRIPWSEVQAIVVDLDRPVVETTLGRFELTRRAADVALGHWRAYRETVGAAVEHEADADLAQVRGWLGIEHGQVLAGWVRDPRLRETSFWRSSRWLVATGVLSVMAVGVWSMEPMTFLPLLLGLPLLWAGSWLCWAVVALPPRVGFSADEYGIDLELYGGRQRVGWDEIVEVTEGADWTLTTRRGVYRLPLGLPHLERLERAMQLAVDARQRGEQVPRLSADVPDTALSRAETSVDAERGLSQPR